MISPNRPRKRGRRKLSDSDSDEEQAEEEDMVSASDQVRRARLLSVLKPIAAASTASANRPREP